MVPAGTWLIKFLLPGLIIRYSQGPSSPPELMRDVLGNAAVDRA